MQPADRIGGAAAVIEQELQRGVARGRRRPAGTPTADRGTAPAAGRGAPPPPRAAGRAARPGARPPRGRRARARSDPARPGALRGADRLRPRNRPPRGRSGRSRRRPGAMPSARAATQRENFRNGRRTREIWRNAPKRLHIDGKGARPRRAFSWRTGPESAIITRLAKAAAKVAELVDALDLGSSGTTHGGSSPPFRTTDSH